MPTDVRKDSLRIPKDSYRNAKDAYRIPRDSYPKITQKWLQNRPPNGSKMAPKWLQNGPPRGPGALLGASWLSLPFVCPYFCLQGASWSALGRLRGRSKVLLSGPWALQDGSQDSFQRSWGPKGSQNGAREGPKSGPGGDSSWNCHNHKT